MTRDRMAAAAPAIVFALTALAWLAIEGRWLT